MNFESLINWKMIFNEIEYFVEHMYMYLMRLTTTCTSISIIYTWEILIFLFFWINDFFEFQILGIAILAGGIVMKEKGGVYYDQYMPLLENITIGSFKMGSLVKALAGFGISLGIFAIVVSIMGIVGAWCKMRILLILVSCFFLIFVLFIFLLIFSLVFNCFLYW